jgi:hypothetical protein
MYQKKQPKTLKIVESGRRIKSVNAELFSSMANI